MQLRELGRSGIRVPPLCLGGNVFGWTVDEARSFELLDRAVDSGLFFIDTADVYSTWAPGNRGGESETIIGRWLKQRGGRDGVVIATKVGSDMGGGRKGLSTTYIEAAVEASLARLQTDHIDLYQSHRDDEATPIEETLDAYARLIRAGKVRAIGASNFTAERLQASLAASARLGLPRYETLQPHYNLIERQGYEAELEGPCRSAGLGVIPYFALARGFLTGKYRSSADLAKSPRGQGVQAYLNERGQAILAVLDAVAAARGATPGQVALAWLMARPGITAPIASATTTAQVDELAAATRLGLEAADIARLDRASAGGAASAP